MRCQGLSRSHPLLIVALTLLVFSTRLTWTQERPSASKTPITPNQRQTLRFRSLDIGYHFSATKYNGLPELWQLAKIDEPQVKASPIIGNAPTEWLTDVIPHNTVHDRTPYSGGDVQYYGHRIPWAGRIILGIGEQAKFHPRVTRVLGLIEPRGLRLENRLPRPWIGR